MTLSDTLETELFDIDWRERAATMLLTVGLLAFGWMLGVQFMTIQARNAAPTLAYTLTDASIQQPYTDAMVGGAAVAVVALCAAVLLDLRRREQ